MSKTWIVYSYSVITLRKFVKKKFVIWTLFMFVNNWTFLIWARNILSNIKKLMWLSSFMNRCSFSNIFDNDINENKFENNFEHFCCNILKFFVNFESVFAKTSFNVKRIVICTQNLMKNYRFILRWLMICIAFLKNLKYKLNLKTTVAKAIYL